MILISLFKRKQKQDGMAGVTIDGTGISLSKICHPEGQPPSLEACVYRSCDISNQASVMAGLVDELNLKGATCSHVLQPGEYTLLFVEAPPNVAAEELKSAVRWRIKDLIDFHIDDAVFDVFDIPGQSHGNRPQMMYVVAVQSTVIQKKVELIQSAGLDISIIDIPELTQRNISALLPEDVAGVALLYLSETGGIITLCRQTVLYLTRNLDIGTKTLFSESEAENRERAFDSVVLEVQRSLDYYESHYAQAPIKTLVISAENENISELINYLNLNLGITSRVLDIDVVIDSKVKIDGALQTHCMPAIGGALRGSH